MSSVFQSIPSCTRSISNVSYTRVSFFRTLVETGRANSSKGDDVIDVT